MKSFKCLLGFHKPVMVAYYEGIYIESLFGRELDRYTTVSVGLYCCNRCGQRISKKLHAGSWKFQMELAKRWVNGENLPISDGLEVIDSKKFGGIEF